MEESSLEGKIIACCGLICSDCPAYRATQENDLEKITALAEQWAKEYGIDVVPETVWCDGCVTDGRKCGHCGECEIRTCATAAGFENCGYCEEMPDCEKLQVVIGRAPQAKDMLEVVALCVKNRKTAEEE